MASLTGKVPPVGKVVWVQTEFMRFIAAADRAIGPATLEVRAAEVFVAVAEELHFGRAADRLHMTQPAVSRHISRLEASLA